MLFPDEIILEIKKNLTTAAEKVLAVIFQQNYLNKSQIRALTALSEKVSNEAIARLEGGCLIAWGEEERSKIYYLTPNGQRLCQLIQSNTENIEGEK